MSFLMKRTNTNNLLFRKWREWGEVWERSKTKVTYVVVEELGIMGGRGGFGEKWRE